MFIAVVNHSSDVTDAEGSLMTRAVAEQMRYHVCPAWGVVVPHLVYVGGADKLIPPGAQQVVLFDNADQQGALGYHDTTPDGQPYARVFTKTTLDNGGQVLDGALSVASVLSHEIGEMKIDAPCNIWWDDWNGHLVAAEIGDPVESGSYAVDVSGSKVMVSNFILPAWGNPRTPAHSRVDWMRACPGPFMMTKGGYTIVASVSGEGQKTAETAPTCVSVNYGEEYPEWKKETKGVPGSRTFRRLTAPPLAA